MTLNVIHGSVLDSFDFFAAVVFTTNLAGLELLTSVS